MGSFGICLGLVSIAPLFIVALGLLVVAGFGNGMTNTTEMLLYQRLIPNHLIGRVRGAALSLIRATYATSIVLGGVLIEPVGTRGVYAIAGAATLLGTCPRSGRSSASALEDRDHRRRAAEVESSRPRPRLPVPSPRARRG